jgi:hypothetical protein
LLAGDEVLAIAILDRLLHHSSVLDTSSDDLTAAGTGSSSTSCSSPRDAISLRRRSPEAKAMMGADAGSSRTSWDVTRQRFIQIHVPRIGKLKNGMGHNGLAE